MKMQHFLTPSKCEVREPSQPCNSLWKVDNVMFKKCVVLTCLAKAVEFMGIVTLSTTEKFVPSYNIYQ